MATRVAAAALMLALPATDPAQGGQSHRDTWFEASLAGLRAGVVSETVESIEDSLLLTTVVTALAVERFGERVDLRQKDEWLETRAGRAMEYRSTRRLAAGEETALRVAVEPDRLVISKTAGREEYDSEQGLDRELVFPEALARLHARRGFVEGDVYSYVAFDPDFELAGACAVKVVGRETLSMSGEGVDLNHIRVVPELYEGMAIDEWRDDRGYLWLQRWPALGMETRRITEAEAARSTAVPDIAESTVIGTNAAISTPGLVDEALYEVWIEGGDVRELLPEDTRQAIEGRTDRGVLLRVARVVPSVDAPRVEKPGDQFSPYLESNPLLQANDPEVGASAEAVAHPSDGAWEAALRIADEVARTIDDDGYGVAFASASEVLSTRSGDCSEHAVLAAAMARSLGIPSRLATGVVYFRLGFGYHMWIEVWTGDGWYAVDPTQGGRAVDATHILLGVSSLSGGRVGELSLPVLRTANRLNIRIVEYVVEGEKVTP